MIDDNFILEVNKKDKILGKVFKEKAHDLPGILHRAFLVLVFNTKGELLLTKRSKKKRLWPDFWDGSIASHFKKVEFEKEEVKKRIKEEAGILAEKIEYLFKFYYGLPFLNIGSENEICYVYSAKAGDEFLPDENEVSGWRWVTISEAKADLKENPAEYCPWFKIAIENDKENNKFL